MHGGMAPLMGEEADEEETVGRVLRPAMAEEGGVGDEGAPSPARNGAAEERGGVREAHEDLENDILRERSRRLN
jgi:hypothetical protein